MSKILFQGDSITDFGRQKEFPYDMGFGYPAYAAARLGLEEPGIHHFFNRGISGNRIVDVYARIKEDIINLQPDYMSLLIGVNDVWHEFAVGNGISAPKFRMLYMLLLDEVKQALPQTQIVLMEPFVLPGLATNENYPLFRSEVEARAQIVRELADGYGLPFIGLQKDLDTMMQDAPEGYWLYDGVHPSIYFHQYIADKWIRTYRSITQN